MEGASVQRREQSWGGGSRVEGTVSRRKQTKPNNPIMQWSSGAKGKNPSIPSIPSPPCSSPKPHSRAFPQPRVYIPPPAFQLLPPPPNQRTTRCAPARGQAALGGGSTAGDLSNRNARVRLPGSEEKLSTRITGEFSYPPTSSRPARGVGWRAFWLFFFVMLLCFGVSG